MIQSRRLWRVPTTSGGWYVGEVVEIKARLRGIRPWVGGELHAGNGWAVLELVRWQSKWRRVPAEEGFGDNRQLSLLVGSEHGQLRRSDGGREETVPEAWGRARTQPGAGRGPWQEAASPGGRRTRQEGTDRQGH